MLKSSKSKRASITTHVYDIANCGPQHRFVANGVLVSNCNYQNMPRAKFDPNTGDYIYPSAELRRCLKAPKGQVIVVADSSQIQARITAWFADDAELLAQFAGGIDPYCAFASVVYGRTITKADKLERFIGKMCIAEGELVLTHRGLVPIEKIKLDDRLWDGVEWVSHSGVIDQGVRDVITYEGLTATPDHTVFTEDGRAIQLWQAASEMVRLQTTGTERKGIRFCDNYFIADTPRKRASIRQGQMRPNWYYEASVSEQLKEGRHNEFLEERQTTNTTKCQSPWKTIRFHCFAMQQTIKHKLQTLWRQRDQVFIRLANSLRSMGFRTPSTCKLQGSRNRSDKQQRALRTGEYQARDQSSTESQQAKYSADFMGRGDGTFNRLQESVQLQLHFQADETRNDRQTNSRQTRVYDIANAGPRFRYTVSNKLVFNCVLGLGFGMGAPRLKEALAQGVMGPPVTLDISICYRLVNTYRRLRKPIVDFWDFCNNRIIGDMIIGREGEFKSFKWKKDEIILPNGLSLHYPGLRGNVNKTKPSKMFKAPSETTVDNASYETNKGRAKLYGGILTENLAISHERCIVYDQMLEINKRYRIVHQAHDENVYLAPRKEAQKALDFGIEEMKRRPSWGLNIPLAAEGGYDECYSK